MATAQQLADRITAAQGDAEDPAKQAEANLAIATGIVNFLLNDVKVAPGIAVTTPAGAGATSAPGSLI